MSGEYYLYCVILRDCYFSNQAHKLLDSHKNIKKEIVIIEQEHKEKYKTDQIKTFPQIYLKKNNANGTQLLGGYSELQNFINKFYGNYNKQYLKDFLDQNNNWSKKSTLRLIELINS